MYNTIYNVKISAEICSSLYFSQDINTFTHRKGGRIMKKTHRAGLWLSLLLTLSMALSAFSGAVYAAGFTATLEGKVMGEGAEEINGMLEGSQIKVAGEAKEDGGVLNAEVVLGGMSIVKLLAKASSEGLQFSFPGADGNCYQISGERLLKLMQSVTSPAGGSPLGIDSQAFIPPEIDPAKYSEAFGPYMQIFSEHIAANVQTTEDAQIELPRLARAYEGTAPVVTGMLAVYQPDAQALASLFEALADQADGDEAMLQIIESWAEYIRGFKTLVSSVSGVTGSSPDEVPLDQAADSMVSFFQALPSQLREAAESLKEEGMPEEALKLTVGVDSAGSGLPVILEAAIKESENETVVFGLQMLFDETGKNIALYGATESEYSEEYMLMIKDQSSGAQARGQVILYVSGAPMGSIEYMLDLTNSSMIGFPYGTCLLSFGPVSLRLTTSDAENGPEGASTHELYINGLGMLTGDQSLDGVDLFLTVSPEAQVEEPSGTITDISDYDMEQLMEVFSGIAGSIAQNFN